MVKSLINSLATRNSSELEKFINFLLSKSITHWSNKANVALRELKAEDISKAQERSLRRAYNHSFEQMHSVLRLQHSVKAYQQRSFVTENR